MWLIEWKIGDKAHWSQADFKGYPSLDHLGVEDYKEAERVALPKLREIKNKLDELIPHNKGESFVKQARLVWLCTAHPTIPL